MHQFFEPAYISSQFLVVSFLGAGWVDLNRQSESHDQGSTSVSQYMLSIYGQRSLSHALSEIVSQQKCTLFGVIYSFVLCADETFNSF